MGLRDIRWHYATVMSRADGTDYGPSLDSDLATEWLTKELSKFGVTICCHGYNAGRSSPERCLFWNFDISTASLPKSTAAN
jgi:hypothetical protein